MAGRRGRVLTIALVLIGVLAMAGVAVVLWPRDDARQAVCPISAAQMSAAAGAPLPERRSTTDAAQVVTGLGFDETTAACGYQKDLATGTDVGDGMPPTLRPVQAVTLFSIETPDDDAARERFVDAAVGGAAACAPREGWGDDGCVVTEGNASAAAVFETSGRLYQVVVFRAGGAEAGIDPTVSALETPALVERIVDAILTEP